MCKSGYGQLENASHWLSYVEILDYSFHCLDADQGVDGHEITEKIRKRLNENQKKTEGTKNHWNKAKTYWQVLNRN